MEVGIRPPVVLTPGEYERDWKPHGWRLIIIGPTSTWRQDWGEWEAIRDAVRVAVDAAEPGQRRRRRGDEDVPRPAYGADQLLQVGAVMPPENVTRLIHCLRKAFIASSSANRIDSDGGAIFGSHFETGKQKGFCR